LPGVQTRQGVVSPVGDAPATHHPLRQSPSTWQAGLGTVAADARNCSFRTLRAAWCHRQSTPANTGMSRRMTLLLTLCNWPCLGAAQVAADILSPLWDVSDVALRAFKLHRGHVILSRVHDAPEAMSPT
jgi:hypothetical protein